MSMRIALGLLFGLGSGFRRGLLCALVAIGFMTSGLAGASTIFSTATPFTGDPLSVSFKISDSRDPGNLVLSLRVDAGQFTGDIYGFFANISDQSLLSGLHISGPQVTGSVFNANNVIDLGQGNNVQGAGSPCPCDFGVTFGTPGIGTDDYQSVRFTLSHDSIDLNLDLFKNQEFAVRVTSVGYFAKERDGSSKLSGSVVPEPTTALLMALGLAGLSAAARRTRP